MGTKKGTSLSLEAVAAVCRDYKGINIVGTGDCHFKPWFKEIQEFLVSNDDHPGILFSPSNPAVGFILQTEVIFTANCGGKRKQAHCIILFPNYDTVSSFRGLLKKWRVKYEAIPRPYIKCKTKDDVSSRVIKIIEIDDTIEFIPAHIMTPTGVFGSNVRVNWLEDFFGESEREIHAVETGLSADPQILSMIPDLDNRTLISNSDAHCADLHRLGREFFSIDTNDIAYERIINSIRNDEIVRTAEFPPEEGRYFLTGHRAARWIPRRRIPKKKQKNWHSEDEFCLFSPHKIPRGDLCPICDRKLTVGVLQRAFELCRVQGEPKRTLEGANLDVRPFKTMIPLVEVIAVSLGIKNPMAKRVVSEYKKIVELFGSEAQFWFHTEPRPNLETISPDLAQNLLQVHAGKFNFWPPGFDGTYGSLSIGQHRNYLDISIIVM